MQDDQRKNELRINDELLVYRVCRPYPGAVLFSGSGKERWWSCMYGGGISRNIFSYRAVAG